MISVVQEIDYLARITETKCSNWKHVLIADKVNDPIEVAAKEGHLLYQNVVDLITAERLLAEQGIFRRLECAADNCFIVPAGKEAHFERVAVQLGSKIEWGVGPPAVKSVFAFTVPDNFTWVVTHIFLRTLPPINDPSLTAALTSSGDFRSSDFEVNGLAQGWIEVNGEAISSKELTTFAFFNKPLLLAFAGKANVQVMIQRDALSIPPTMIVQTCFHGYLTDAPVYSILQWSLTSIQGTFEANP